MEYLKKSISQEEYKKYLQKYDNAVLHSRVNLVNNELKYFDKSSLFYIEAISDISISQDSMRYRDYSFDGENWVDNSDYSSAKTITVPSGCRVYMKTGSNSLKVTGTYKIGGGLLVDTFSNESGLLEVNDDLILNPFSSYKFTGCVNLVRGPRVIAPINIPKSDYNSVNLKNLFENCTSLEESPIILIKGLAYNTYGSLILDSLYKGCCNLTSEIVIKSSTIYSSATFSATGWLDGVPIGTLVLSPNLYNKLKTSFIPDGWKILLSDINSDLRYINFTLDNKTYYSDEGMTWREWVSSEYNTIGLKISGNNIINDLGTLYIGGAAVLSTDLVTCTQGINYIINTTV